MTAPISPDRDIRPYRASDWETVYDICVKTGDAGEDVSGRYVNDSIFPDIWAGPYLSLEPDLAYVIESGQQVVGYVLGTADTKSFVERYRREWIPAVASSYCAPTSPPTTAYEHLLSLLFHPEAMILPLVDQYPAHLHIDILPGHRGKGAGRRLIGRFVDAVRQQGAVGVHAGVASKNVNALRFYYRVGFRELCAGSEVPVTYLGLSLSARPADRRPDRPARPRRGPSEIPRLSSLGPGE